MVLVSFWVEKDASKHTIKTVPGPLSVLINLNCYDYHQYEKDKGSYIAPSQCLKFLPFIITLA